MTDCYLCGHEILKGQKKLFIHPPDVDPMSMVDLVPVHLNIQDCLPTLSNSSQRISKKAFDGLAGLTADVKQRERERAANMAEEADSMAHGACADNCAGCIVTATLAQRIRSGE